MVGHRFEIGERVTYCEKRFPTGVWSTEMVVIEQLTGEGEPEYQLRVYGGVAECVLAESQLSPRLDSHEAKRRFKCTRSWRAKPLERVTVRDGSGVAALLPFPRAMHLHSRSA